MIESGSCLFLISAPLADHKNFTDGSETLNHQTVTTFFKKIEPHNRIFAMALYQRAPYQTTDRQILGDESDQEEDTLVNDYQEQVQFDDGFSEMDPISMGMGGGGQLQDMQAQLAAAATPLEYQATLETKFNSYDNYCNLFHYILNSDGPVDLEVPSVRQFSRIQCA